MKIEFTAKIEAKFLLTAEQADMLVACSRAHYDHRCRAASSTSSMYEPTNSNGQVVPGTGFILSWKYMTERNAEDGPDADPWEIRAKWPELDLACKCMEWGPPGETIEVKAIRFKTQMQFMALMRRMSELHAKWQDTMEME